MTAAAQERGSFSKSEIGNLKANYGVERKPENTAKVDLMLAFLEFAGGEFQHKTGQYWKGDTATTRYQRWAAASRILRLAPEEIGETNPEHRRALTALTEFVKALDKDPGYAPARQGLAILIDTTPDQPLANLDPRIVASVLSEALELGEDRIFDKFSHQNNYGLTVNETRESLASLYPSGGENKPKKPGLRHTLD